MGEFLQLLVGIACLYLFGMAFIAFLVEDNSSCLTFLVIAFVLIGLAFGGGGSKETPNYGGVNLGNQMPKQNYTMYDADTGKVDTLSSVSGSHLANTGSELKNTCKRCDKVWYLATGELQDLESRLSTAQKAIGQMSGLTMISALTNPGMLTAQMGTSNMAALGPVQQLQKELEEKSRCPECQSKSIERELVDDHDELVKEEEKSEDGNSLADGIMELNKLKEQGILDDEEFKSAKRKLIEKQ